MLLFGLVILGFGLLGIFIDPLFFIFVAILIIVIICIHFGFRTSQIYDECAIEKYKNKKIIYEKMAQDQIPQFVKYLSEVYPNIEKDIFGKISPQNISLYAVKYPEIKSNETIMELVSLINRKQASIYDCELSVIEYKRSIDQRRKVAKMWLFKGYLD